MMKNNLLTTLYLAACLTGLAAQTGSASAQSVQSCTAVTPETCSLAHKLGRGINMGNMLEAPQEGDWGLRLDAPSIDRVAGTFKTVRVPVRWSNHASATADATLDEVFATRVDKVIDALLAKGVYVILDMHHNSQLFGDRLLWNEFSVDPAVVETRVVNMWRQIALRYKDRSPKLLFELLNEPHGRLDGEPWNVLAAKSLAAVRTSNPARTVLIGPSYWNNVRDLPKLRLPADRNLIVSIHNYTPFEFTHQGVTYLPKPFPTGTTCCNAQQQKAMTDSLDTAVKWSQTNGYPLHLGEFGAHQAADMASRETYTRLMRDELERRNIGWTYWDFAASYGVYSPKTGNWIEPIRRALLD
jgi:endoglucanase